MPHEEKSKFEFEEKKFSLLLKREVCRRFWLEKATFSNKLNFFPQIQILIFLCKQLRITIIDCCISLKMIKKILVVLGVVDTRQLLLNGQFYIKITYSASFPALSKLWIRKSLLIIANCPTIRDKIKKEVSIYYLKKIFEIN